jgi:hypothetical protein
VAQKEARDDWLRLAQVVLLNLLLPLLTAALGYTFGRNERALEKSE